MQGPHPVSPTSNKRKSNESEECSGHKKKPKFEEIKNSSDDNEDNEDDMLTKFGEGGVSEHDGPPETTLSTSTPGSVEEEREKLLKENLAHFLESMDSTALEYDERFLDLFESGRQKGKGNLLMSDEVCEWISILLEYPDVRSKATSALVEILSRRW